MADKVGQPKDSINYPACIREGDKQNRHLHVVTETLALSTFWGDLGR